MILISPLFLLGAVACPGSVLFAQPPHPTGGVLAMEEPVPPCDGVHVEVADDFQHTSDLLAVRWWGTFGLFEPSSPDAFRIRIYQDADGLPGDTLYDGLFTGFEESGGAPWSYCVEIPADDHPGSLVERERYWISIQAQFCYPPEWYWSTSTDAPDGPDLPAVLRSNYFGPADWTPAHDAPWIGVEEPANLAVELRGAGSVPVTNHSWATLKSVYRHDVETLPAHVGGVR